MKTGVYGTDRAMQAFVRLLTIIAIVCGFLPAYPVPETATAAPASVSGVVTESGTGVPIAGATVSYLKIDSSESGFTTTNASGAYSLTLPANGSYEIRAEALRCEPKWVSVDFTGAPLVRNFSLERQVKWLTGIVTDSQTLLPVPGAWVEAVYGGRTYTDHTDPSGRYELWVSPEAPRQYELRAGGSGYYTTTNELIGFDGIPVASDKNFSLTPRGPSVYGKVLQAGTVTPLQGAIINVSRGSFVAQVQTDADGNYEVELPGTGEYSIWVGLAGYKNQAGTFTYTGTAVLRDYALVPNAPPHAQNHKFSVDMNGQLSLPAPGLLDGAADVDDPPSALTVEHVPGSGPINGELSMDADGSLAYTPFTDFEGTDVFSYVVYDGSSRSAPATVSISVVNPAVVRIEGSGRFSTAVAASREAYPDGASAVVIATGRNWPDALGGAALAGVVEGPVLLVDTNSVPPVVMDEIENLGAAKAYIVGGTGAVGPAVESALEAKLGSGNVVRIYGANRYETANKVAAKVKQLQGGAYDGGALVATAANFPDALAAAPLAAKQGWPLYLAHPTSGLSAETKAAMAGTKKVLILGGTGVVPPSVEDHLKSLLPGAGKVVRLWGSNRYQTAVAIASHAVNNEGHVWERVGIATGQNFPDALAGGVLQGKVGSVMLLTPSLTLSPDTQKALIDNSALITRVTFFGGTGAVSTAVRQAVLKAIE